MKHRIISAAAITGASLMAATPAFANGATHGHTTIANIIHWLSSPTHSLFAVIGGIIFVAATVKLARKKRA